MAWASSLGPVPRASRTRRAKRLRDTQHITRRFRPHRRKRNMGLRLADDRQRSWRDERFRLILEDATVARANAVLKCSAMQRPQAG